MSTEFKRIPPQLCKVCIRLWLRPENKNPYYEYEGVRETWSSNGMFWVRRVNEGQATVIDGWPHEHIEKVHIEVQGSEEVRS